MPNAKTPIRLHLIHKIPIRSSQTWPNVDRQVFCRGGTHVVFVEEGLMLKVGDRVRVRWLTHSDCLGLTGTVLETQPSAFFGRKVERCRVDFKGRRRSVLSILLIRVCEKTERWAVAA